MTRSLTNTPILSSWLQVGKVGRGSLAELRGRKGGVGDQVFYYKRASQGLKKTSLILHY